MVLRASKDSGGIDAWMTVAAGVGANTCYDLRFPGLWTELVAAGAKLVIVPAA